VEIAKNPYLVYNGGSVSFIDTLLSQGYKKLKDPPDF